MSYKNLLINTLIGYTIFRLGKAVGAYEVGLKIAEKLNEFNKKEEEVDGSDKQRGDVSE